jgi:hypothetical protein
MNILSIIIGLILLFVGRKLYWLFVAVVGFAVGFYLAGLLLPQTAPIVHVLIGLVAGVLGAAFAVFLHQLAVGIAGFIGGGWLALQLLSLLGFSAAGLNWIPFIIGGIIGAVLVVLVFDWALIVLSSLAGAFLVGSAINILALWSDLIILVLFLIGLVTQASILKRDRENK